MVDVIDVNTQQALELTLQNWVKYFTSPNRERIYNVISLEFSHTKLEDIVEPPSVVRTSFQRLFSFCPEQHFVLVRVLLYCITLFSDKNNLNINKFFKLNECGIVFQRVFRGYDY